MMRRRRFLFSLALMALSVTVAKAKVIWGGVPWTGKAATGPTPVVADGWKFFTPDEAALVEAISDRLIPADDLSIGGKEAGCAVFIDSQLAGPYGKAATEYRAGPFRDGLPQQGPQFSQTPAERYRTGLAAFDVAVKKAHANRRFIDLHPADQDTMLRQLEAGELHLTVDASSGGALKGLNGQAFNGQAFFGMVLGNVREGFFSDPIYGGNKDMAGWKMLGFPGAQYDFRDVIGRRGEKLDIKPISLIRKKA